MDIVVWLRSLGLGKYEAAFRESDIDETVLPSLTEEQLKQLGCLGRLCADDRNVAPTLIRCLASAPVLLLRSVRAPLGRPVKVRENKRPSALSQMSASLQKLRFPQWLPTAAVASIGMKRDEPSRLD